MHRKGKYRKTRNRRPAAITAALAGVFALGMVSGSDTLLGLAVVIIIVTAAAIVLRPVKRVLALAFIGLGIALDKQTRTTFRETWEEHHSPA